jgi:hypothetical protein
LLSLSLSFSRGPFWVFTKTQGKREKGGGGGKGKEKTVGYFPLLPPYKSERNASLVPTPKNEERKKTIKKTGKCMFALVEQYVA